MNKVLHVFGILGKGIANGLRSVIPVVQDPPREWIRKLAFWLAILIIVGAGYFLLDELWIQPQRTMGTLNTLRDLYHTDGSVDTPAVDDNGNPIVYPTGMDPSFYALYARNADVRGWLTFASGNGDSLFNGAIDNPVVQAKDNDYYLNHDFWGERDKAGTLYFDYRNDLTAASEDRHLIIYGHNLTSELMFSRFNRLVIPNVNYARLLTTLQLDTLYEKGTYKVLALMVLDADAKDATAFNYLRTQFHSEEDFLYFTEEIRRRSIYDFGDVDVQEGDELLTLSSCTNQRESKLRNGRVVIVARRVRDGESTKVDASKTVINDDVLMPKAWYVNQKKELPAEYVTGTTKPHTESTATTTVTASSTAPSGTVTTTETTGTATEPAETTTKPTGTTTKPTGATTKPTGTTTKPTGTTTKPMSTTTKPTTAGTTGTATGTTTAAVTTTTTATTSSTGTTAAETTTQTMEQTATTVAPTTATSSTGTTAAETTTQTVAQTTTTASAPTGTTAAETTTQTVAQTTTTAAVSE